MARFLILVATTALYICAYTASVNAHSYATSGGQPAKLSNIYYAYIMPPAILSYPIVPAQNNYGEAINVQPGTNWPTQAQSSGAQILKAINYELTHKDSASERKPQPPSGYYEKPSTSLQPRPAQDNNFGGLRNTEGNYNFFNPTPTAKWTLRPTQAQNRGYHLTNGQNRHNNGFPIVTPATEWNHKSTQNQNHGSQTDNGGDIGYNGLGLNNIGKLNPNPTQPPPTQGENHNQNVNNENHYTKSDDRKDHLKPASGTSPINEHICNKQAGCRGNNGYGGSESTQSRPAVEREYRFNQNQVSAGEDDYNSRKRSDSVTFITASNYSSIQDQNYRGQAGNLPHNGLNYPKPAVTLDDSSTKTQNNVDQGIYVEKDKPTARSENYNHQIANNRNTTSATKLDYKSSSGLNYSPTQEQPNTGQEIKKYENQDDNIKPSTEWKHTPIKGQYNVVYPGNRGKNEENINNQQHIIEPNVANGGHADKIGYHPYHNQGNKQANNANNKYFTSSPPPQTSTNGIYVQPYWEIINARNRNNTKKTSHNRKHDSHKSYDRNSHRKRWKHQGSYKKQYSNKDHKHSHSYTHRNGKDYKPDYHRDFDSSRNTYNFNKNYYNNQKYKNDGRNYGKDKDRSNYDAHDYDDQHNSYNNHKQYRRSRKYDGSNGYYNSEQYVHEGDDSVDQKYDNGLKRQRNYYDYNNYNKNNGDDNYNRDEDLERQKYNNGKRSGSYRRSYEDKNRDGRDSRRNDYHYQSNNGKRHNHKSGNNDNANSGTFGGKAEQVFKNMATSLRNQFDFI